MRIAVIGGGPAGLYFAALARAVGPIARVTVWERNAADDTFGFGVVLSDETLGGIEHADPAVFAAHARASSRAGTTSTSTTADPATPPVATASPPSPASGCCTSSRPLPQPRRRPALQRPGTARRRLAAEYDLVVAADGVHSATRATLRGRLPALLDVT